MSTFTRPHGDAAVGRGGSPMGMMAAASKAGVRSLGYAASDTSPRAADSEAAVLARWALKRRTGRLQQFGHDLAQDGVWNMLLELVIAKAERRLVPIKCLWLASGLPQSTSLRCINHLVAGGYVTRIGDPADGRRQFIELTEPLAQRIAAFLRATEP